jgi:DNA-binding transcriptional LysR family regulator
MTDLRLLVAVADAGSVALFQRLARGVRLTPAGQIVTAVVSGRADLGIVAWDGEHPALRFAPYRMDELVLVVAPGHALARRREVRFAECAMLPFVGLPFGSAIHTFLMERSSELGLTLDVRVQVWGFAAVCGLVAAGVGVAVVPRSVTVGDTATLDVDPRKRHGRAAPRTDHFSLGEILFERATASLSREHIIHANPSPHPGSRKNKPRRDIEVGTVSPTDRRDGDT